MLGAALIAVSTIALLLLAARAQLAKNSPPGLPKDAIAPAGAQLPGGFVISEGSVQLGPVLPTKVGQNDKPMDWFALIAVTGEPLTVWKDYARQLSRAFPDDGIDPNGPLCVLARLDGFGCGTGGDRTVGEGSVVSAASLDSIPGDVTGRYLIRFETYHRAHPDDGDPPQKRYRGQTFKEKDVPDPEKPRRRPRTGEPLAPKTTAYKGDNRRYVLAEGSELVAQWGSGSHTGGFTVLLKIKPSSQIKKVSEAYVRQASEIQGRTRRKTQSIGKTVVTTFHPPGGAGGYSATIHAVDQAGTHDFIFYELIND